MARLIPTGLGALLLALSLAAFAGSAAYPLDVLSNLRFQLALAALVAVGGALALRARPPAVLATAALAVNVLVIAPLYTGDQPKAQSGARLVIGHVNMQGRDGDLTKLERVLRARRPDVVVVLEAPQAWGRLAHGFAGYRAFESGRGDIALARIPVRLDSPVAALGREARPFRIRLGDRDVRVVALHTPSPTTPTRARERDRELRAAGLWAARVSGDAIVLGDLNATPWSHSFHDLVRTGRLHSSLSGFGLQATWPSALGRFGIPIDHLLYSDGLAVVAREIGPSFGSEHRSLWVTVARA